MQDYITIQVSVRPASALMVVRFLSSSGDPFEREEEVEGRVEKQSSLVRVNLLLKL